MLILLCHRKTRYKDRLEDTLKDLIAFMDINKHVYVLSVCKGLDD